MEKILISGGMGFVGKNLVSQLYNRYKIIVLDKYKDEEFQLNKDIKFIEYEFDDNKLKEIILKYEPDYIINLISIVTAERDLSLFKPMIESNLEILIKFYSACSGLTGLKLFIQFGSGEEYGNISPPFSEDSKECPMSPYALVKQLTTNTSMMLAKNYDFPITVVRPGNIFGRYQNKDKFIPYILNKLKENTPLHLSPCEQKRDFIDVKQLVSIIERFLKEHERVKGQIFNVSSGKSYSLKEIISFCQKKINSSSEIIYGKLPYRDNEMMDFHLDITKLKNLLDIDDDYFEIYNSLEKMINEELM